ncbi:hypothetical protein GCM10009530_41880 [Microbispora corallina]|uniref:Uncharacterized protein n=1 Tax=Microbispora corallina TaxID=83302 RepID=A0ABQ4G1C1_9ACTN|nr:hypothetical protein [Microbispora corallina]GIH40883.1 hypothetical protein Mco01_38830 [Microbispora corallina]
MCALGQDLAADTRQDPADGSGQDDDPEPSGDEGSMCVCGR